MTDVLLIRSIGRVEIMKVDLEDYLKNKMQMSHVYQPVMLKVLLKNDSEASLENIASALLSYDISQLQYYELRTKKMVGKILSKNKVVEPIKKGRITIGYRLSVASLSEAQRGSLIAICEDKIIIIWHNVVRPYGTTEGLQLDTLKVVHGMRF